MPAARPVATGDGFVGYSHSQIGYREEIKISKVLKQRINRLKAYN
jgi:hypothetical protein